ncbi:MAG: hypothetical protein WC329_05250, partial [Candidatus Omnitrophota bacterium]
MGALSSKFLDSAQSNRKSALHNPKLKQLTLSLSKGPNPKLKQLTLSLSKGPNPKLKQLTLSLS